MSCPCSSQGVEMQLPALEWTTAASWCQAGPANQVLPHYLKVFQVFPCSSRVTSLVKCYSHPSGQVYKVFHFSSSNKPKIGRFFSFVYGWLFFFSPHKLTENEKFFKFFRITTPVRSCFCPALQRQAEQCSGVGQWTTKLSSSSSEADSLPTHSHQFYWCWEPFLQYCSPQFHLQIAGINRICRAAPTGVQAVCQQKASSQVGDLRLHT